MGAQRTCGASADLRADGSGYCLAFDNQDRRLNGFQGAFGQIEIESHLLEPRQTRCKLRQIETGFLHNIQLVSNDE